MAGHSAWSNIKHRNAAQDKVKGRVWSKCSRAIMVAARNGGGDPKFNTTLRYAIDEARAANMPKENVEKAIKKGTGELEGSSYESVRYEGYAPGGVAIIVDCLTDKQSRTAPEMRTLFDKHEGKIAKPGAVAFSFDMKGVIVIESSKVSEDKLMTIALDAGADDVVDIGGAWQVTCQPSVMIALKDALAAAEIEPDSAEVTMVPQNTVQCDASLAGKVLKFIEALDEHDDVQKVYHNAEIPEDVMAQIN
ncbi:MAG TPA: YebC/PmpR family DNA-binding transcriptional regulator [Phycisphaerales bacterium]|nr:YebC/PmpR family DNA-binding transcriptional regulator [Phycisphaerales bacterium]